MPPRETPKPSATTVALPAGTQAAADTRSSDRGAIARWYVDRFPKLCTHASHLGAGQDAEDVVHDVLARWLAGLNGRRIDGLPVDSYWYTAIKNRVLNLMSHERVARRWVESQPQGEPATWCGPESVVEARELAASVNNVLGALPLATRQAFHLVKERGMSYEAATRELGLTTKAVRRRVERAVAAIRSELGRDTPPFGHLAVQDSTGARGKGRRRLSK